MSNALLVLRTISQLRWQQLLYRPLRRVQRRLPPPRTASAWTLSDRLPAMQTWLELLPPPDPDAALRRAGQVRSNRFSFLGSEQQLEPLDWQARYQGRLWTYHLHYFDYALDLAHAWRRTGDAEFCGAFERLALGWIAHAETGSGDGWDPYPISTRVPNWLLALLLFGEALPEHARRQILDSAHHQLVYLEQRLEYDLLANHLQRNLYALAVGGLFFDCVPAARWRSRRTAELWRQLDEQVLADGGHFERSPMYHALALADFLTAIELRQAAGEPVPEAALARVALLAQALARLSRPDGSLHLFNDSSHGAAPPTSWLLARAARMFGEQPGREPGAWQLPQTGYYGWSSDAAGERFIIDCGELGPDYNPAHGHCDALSFELDLFGLPVCVDAGLAGYDDHPLRAYVRSTAAHNTVVIDGREQSELWATFRVARRVRPVFARQQVDREDYRFEGAYQPYFDGRVCHARNVTRDQRGWTISDRVTGARGRTLRSYLHFHPDCLLSAAGTRFRLRVGGQVVALEIFGTDDVALLTGRNGAPQHWYCPAFGTAIPSPTLVMTVTANDGREFGYRISTAATP